MKLCHQGFIMSDQGFTFGDIDAVKTQEENAIVKEEEKIEAMAVDGRASGPLRRCARKVLFKRKTCIVGSLQKEDKTFVTFCNQVFFFSFASLFSFYQRFCPQEKEVILCCYAAHAVFPRRQMRSGRRCHFFIFNKLLNC